jgi:3-oxoacyl-[acyl-carrier protein] reductase
MIPQPLTNRVALVTGAGVGIGRAAALALANAGATLGLHYHTSAEGARQTQRDIEVAGGKAFLLPGDLTLENDACAVVDALVEHAGRLDILFNNAGSPVQMVKLEECSLELWRRVFDVNVTSAFLVTRRAIPHLKSSGHGAILDINGGRFLR